MFVPGRKHANRFSSSLTVATHPGEVNLLACPESSAPMPARLAHRPGGGARRPVERSARRQARRGAGAAGPADRPRRHQLWGNRGGGVVSGLAGPADQKIASSQLARDAYVYVRQSTPGQVAVNTESLARQYELRERAVSLGWNPAQVIVIDADLGQSGARSAGRLGVRGLVAEAG